MSGLFKPTAQDTVFTLGDEVLEEENQSFAAVTEKGNSRPSVGGAKDIASLPVSSAAGAKQGALTDGSEPAHTSLQSAKASSAEEHAAANVAGQNSLLPGTASDSQAGAALPDTSVSSHQQKYQNSAAALKSRKERTPAPASQPAAAQHLSSTAQNGSAQPAQEAKHADSATEEEGGRHLEEDEEQKFAEELAALEAEAEAEALQEQRRRSTPSPPGSTAHGGDSISLNDGASQAERAMAEAQRTAQEASAGTTAMQSALDGFEPRKRPFSPPPGSAPLQRFSPSAEYVEPSDFQGLLFFDGLDSLGRPVIIVNADAMGENKGARKSAFQFIVHTLEPVVIQGPYVLLLVSLAGGSKSNKVQTGLLVSAYRGLSRPFRKNVKYIILVRPSKPLKALLSFLRPFVSRKAHRKVLKIEDLSAVAEATNGEVTLANLGPRFTAAAAEPLQ